MPQLTQEQIDDGKLLRDEVIKLRDIALKQNDFEWAVKLSHVAAFMFHAIGPEHFEVEKPKVGGRKLGSKNKEKPDV